MKRGGCAFDHCISVPEPADHAHRSGIRRLLRHLALAFILLVLYHTADAQTNPLSERRFYARSVDYAVSNLIESQKAIYNGPLYHQYFVDMTTYGHPFYHNLQPESILYDGIVYSRVNFIYDVFKDEVLVINPDSNWIALDKNKIAHFYLGGHKIKNINDVPGLNPGLYEVLVENGQLALVAKWTKLFRASAWKEKVDFFLVRDKVYEVKTRKELLAILSDKQVELKEYIRKNDLSFKKDKAADFKKVVEYYITLSE